MPHDIVYVIGPQTDPAELTYSLRSVEVNFPHRLVWIVGTLPPGIKPDRYIKHWAVSKVEKELHFSRSEQNRVHRKALISFYDANTELVEEYHEWHNSED